jgi:hypothetical protein
LLFAPVLDLGKYFALLQDAGKAEEEITDILNRIRRQGVHRLFYWPPVQGLNGESVVALDAIREPLSSIDLNSPAT